MVIARDCFESQNPLLMHPHSQSTHIHLPAGTHGETSEVTSARLKEFLGLSEKEGGGLLIAVFISATVLDCP